MVTIISKQDGSSNAEAEFRHTLKENRATIEGMAQALKRGPMAHLAPEPLVQPPPDDKTTTVSYPRILSEGSAKPYVRVSLNGRVVLVDYETGNQLHHLGEVRGKGKAARFALATKANGFFAPLDADLAESLRRLDGALVPDREAEEAFKVAVAMALGLAS